MWSTSAAGVNDVICFIGCSSSVVYTLLQRPLGSGKRISRNMVSHFSSPLPSSLPPLTPLSLPSPPPQWFRIVRYSLLVALTSILWTLGLTLCGALRTILLWEHSEVALMVVFGTLASMGGNSKVSEFTSLIPKPAFQVFTAAFTVFSTSAQY